MQAKKLTVLAMLTLSSGAALAFDEAPLHNFYVGADIGQSSASDVCNGTQAFGASCSTTATAFRGTFGYQFNPTVGVELSYENFGTDNASAVVQATAISADAKADGFDVSAVGSFPLSREFSLQGRVGVATINWKVEGSGGGYSTSASNSKTNLIVGAGARYALTNQIALLARYDFYGKVGDSSTTGTTNLYAWTVGAQFTF